MKKIVPQQSSYTEVSSWENEFQKNKKASIPHCLKSRLLVEQNFYSFKLSERIIWWVLSGGKRVRFSTEQMMLHNTTVSSFTIRFLKRNIEEVEVGLRSSHVVGITETVLQSTVFSDAAFSTVLEFWIVLDRALTLMPKKQSITKTLSNTTEIQPKLTCKLWKSLKLVFMLPNKKIIRWENHRSQIAKKYITSTLD